MSDELTKSFEAFKQVRRDGHSAKDYIARRSKL